MSTTTHARDGQQGVGLIEVLVSILVLALGVLGTAALQARMIKANQSSLQRTQAVMLNYYILDAMRVDRLAALSGAYNMDKTCTVPAAAGTLVLNNRKAWLQTIKDQAVLSNADSACGEINCDGGGNCKAKVFWDDSRAEGSAAQVIETRTRL